MLVVAHGAGPDWNGQVEAVVSRVQAGGMVEVAYLMGPGAETNRFQDQVAKLAAAGAREVVVVPLLVSSHSGHYEQIRYLVGQVDTLSEVMMHHLEMGGLERPTAGVPIRLAPAIDDALEIVEVLAARAAALAPDAGGKALFVIGHGPNSAEDNALWMRNLRVITDSLRARTDFADVRIGLVRDDAPPEVRAEAVRAVRELIEMQHAITGQDVIVVPVLIATGPVSRDKFTRDLAGLPIVYSGDALLPHPAMSRLIESRVARAGSYMAVVPAPVQPSASAHSGMQQH